jgi:hypothetical protein
MSPKAAGAVSTSPARTPARRAGCMLTCFKPKEQWNNPSINQSSNQSIKQAINQSSNQSIKQAINQSSNQSIN